MSCSIFDWEFLGILLSLNVKNFVIVSLILSPFDYLQSTVRRFHWPTYAVCSWLTSVVSCRWQNNYQQYYFRFL